MLVVPIFRMPGLGSGGSFIDIVAYGRTNGALLVNLPLNDTIYAGDTLVVFFGGPQNSDTSGNLGGPTQDSNGGFFSWLVYAGGGDVFGIPYWPPLGAMFWRHYTADLVGGSITVRSADSGQANLYRDCPVIVARFRGIDSYQVAGTGSALSPDVIGGSYVNTAPGIPMNAPGYVFAALVVTANTATFVPTDNAWVEAYRYTLPAESNDYPLLLIAYYRPVDSPGTYAFEGNFQDGNYGFTAVMAGVHAQ